MNTTTLQVPISKRLKASATVVAQEYGFSSLQEVVRVLLTKLSKKELSVSVEQFPAVKLSAKNAKRYDKIVDDYLSGKLKTKSFDNVDDLMEDLMK